MRILVTNDDGVESRGIITLAEALQVLGDVTVVAPDDDRSGVGHSVSVRHQMRVSPLEDRAVRTFSCSGTPADCIIVGAYELCGGLPDLVVSGINRGANLGDDINYSGTVAAAIEALIVGVPSIAVSLAASWPRESPVHHWDTAATAAIDAARGLIAEPIGLGTLLNINVPNLPATEITGTEYTRQGRKRYTERLGRGGEENDAFFWVWGKAEPSDNPPDADMTVVARGGISITPLALERTDRSALDRLRRSASVSRS